MKPQASITKITSGNTLHFLVSREDDGETREVETQFNEYQQALDYILEQGWQLKREPPQGSLHVDTRFLKP